MPKGRGSNERRRSPRQRTAVRMGRLDEKDPRSLYHDTMKGRRRIGKRNSANFTVRDHKPNRWDLKTHPRTEKAAKQTEKNKRRRASNWKKGH